MNRLKVGTVFIFLTFVILTIYFTNDIVNDDTYITLRYSKNLIEHHQFTYNLDCPTYSTTTPLWAIIVGLIGFIHHNYIIVAQVLAAILALLAAWILYRFGETYLGQDAFLPAGFFLLDPYVIGAVYNGTEMALFAVLEVLFTWTVMQLKSEFFSHVICGILLSLLILTRPEGILVFLLVALYMLLLRPYGDTVTGLKVMFKVACASFVIILPWLVYAFTTFHTLLPTSIILKSVGPEGRGLFPDIITIKRLTSFIVKGYSPHFMVILISIIFPQYRKNFSVRKGSENQRKELFLLSFFLIVGLLLFYFAGLKEKVISSRYLVTFSPFIALCTSSSLLTLRNNGEILRSRHKLFTLVIYIFFILLIVENIAVMKSRITRCETEDRPRIVVGKWIAKNIHPSSIIANFGGAGAIAYYFKGKVWDYDLISMVGKDIQFAQRRRKGNDIPVDQFFYKKPDYIVISNRY